MAETFKTFHRILSVAGISMFAKNNWNSKKWLTLQIINFIIGLQCSFFTSGLVLLKFSDFFRWIEGATIWTTGLVMSVTLGVCLIYRNEFRGFLEDMIFKDGMLEMPLIHQLLLVPRDTPKLAELSELVVSTQEKLLKYMRLLVKSYFSSSVVCCTLYICNAIYEMSITEDESLRRVAFEMWFPWSLQNTNIYIASFIFNVYCAYLVCLGYSGLQSTIILFLGQVIRQLRILSFILLHLNDLVLEMTGAQDKKWQAYCTLILSQTIDHYAKLKRFSNQFNVICQPFYLTLILVSTLLVCVCSVKIAISNKLSVDIMRYYIHEVSFILVVLSFCLLGQQVQNECEVLERVVTEKWYIFNKNHRKNVQIFEMALSQRMPIYIFGTVTLSLPTFTWFIKTGMSFFTLVMSVFEEGYN